MASKKTAAAVAPPDKPEALIRLAFKEADLKLLIDKLETAGYGIPPELKPIYHRLKMRLSEHQLKAL